VIMSAKCVGGNTRKRRALVPTRPARPLLLCRLISSTFTFPYTYPPSLPPSFPPSLFPPFPFRRLLPPLFLHYLHPACISKIMRIITHSLLPSLPPSLPSPQGAPTARPASPPSPAWSRRLLASVITPNMALVGREGGREGREGRRMIIIAWLDLSLDCTGGEGQYDDDSNSNPLTHVLPPPFPPSLLILRRQ